MTSVRTFAADLDADERRLIEAAEPSHRVEYERLKSEWEETNHELSACLAREEDQRLRNANTEIEFAGRFSPTYVQLRETEAIADDLSERIAVKQARPDLGRREVEALVAECVRQRKERLDRLRIDAAQADEPPTWRDAPPWSPGLARSFADHQNEVRRVLLQLYRLCHPDCTRRPGGLAFTEVQLAELDAIYRRVTEIGHSELRNSHRSLAVLEGALQRARAILKTAGLDVDPSTVILGDSLPERIEWLSRAIARNRADIEHSRARLFGLLTDPDITTKGRLLADESRHEAVRAALECELRVVRRRIQSLRREWRGLFRGAAR